ncbi:MAG TPA: CehA/McbA family metallohydrolase, partial [Verrucomicrobiae bacterium]
MVFAAAANVAVLFLTPSIIHAAALPVVKGVEWQPLSAQVTRLIEAMDFLGSPLSANEKKAIQAAGQEADSAVAVEKLQAILDGHCLFGLHINPEMRVKVAPGPAAPRLVEQGWRQFLVKVQNESGTTAALTAVSPNAVSLFESGASRTASDQFFRKKGEQQPLSKAADLWLDLQTFDKQPLKATLSGLGLEYRIIQLYSRDAGKREAKFSFNVGQGTQDIGFRNETDVLFNIEAARPVAFRVKDENGKPTTASFLIRDAQQRVYPSQAKRLAPDFAFHPQVYRADGETVRLPAGDYTIEFSRGPESVTKTTKVKVDARTKDLSFQSERWIDPSKLGWWSGDHHIHAAGCAHYVKPTEGVHAVDMIRHCVGEDLKIGANLTWGPCFDYQKQFFCGTVDKVSQYPYLLRYDIEVSGFGSHQSGHLVLLRLKDQMYPGGESKDHWPTLCLNTLRWAKKQGAVVGPAHSGWGLEVKGEELPNYNVPKFDGIGANEYIVDVTHEVPGPDGKLVPAVDFISTVDTPPIWELNIWYHTLNAGYRTRISGETDFPCIYGEKVGLGRSYVKLDGKLDYDAWCEGIRQGRNYVSDGKSHLIDFKVREAATTEAGGEVKITPQAAPLQARTRDGKIEVSGGAVSMGEMGSQLNLSAPATVRVSAQVAAMLDEERNSNSNFKRFHWHIEKARITGTRSVPVELIVNGVPVASQNIVADGRMMNLNFTVKIDRSSWVALRILPSSHTNPIFVL